MTPTRPVLLLVKFIKVASRAFDIQLPDETEKSILAEQKKISRQLIPFFTSPRRGANYSGVFLAGDRPSWILSTDKGGIRIIPSGYSVVHAFTACSIWESKGDFLLYSEEVCIGHYSLIPGVPVALPWILYLNSGYLTYEYPRLFVSRALVLWNGCLMFCWKGTCRRGVCPDQGRAQMSCSSRQLP